MSRSAIEVLPDGLIESSAATPNIQSVSELARIVEQTLAAVGARRERLALVLPDLAITTVVFQGGGQGRSRSSEKDLRRELGASLPYPVSDARLDFWRGRQGEALGAAIRGAVVRQYERVVEAVDCRPGWVDGASLCQIPSQVSRRGQPGFLEVHVQLYAEHYCLTAVRSGELVDTRIKLRSAADLELVAREVLRAPMLYDNDAVDALYLSGLDATAVGELFGAVAEVREVRVVNDGEQRHLVSSIERLLERGSP